MTPDLLILACLLLPAAGAIFCLIFRQNAAPLIVTSALGFLAALGLVAATRNGEVFAISVGSWTAPYGISLVADGFAALMLAVCSLIVLAATLCALKTLSVHYRRRNVFALISTLSLGANGAFLTGDLFNLYVWFEVLLLSSFAIMAIMTGKEAQSATWRYVVINLVASLLFLAAAGLIYGKTGTLNFANLHLRFQEAENSFLINSSAALLFGAFGIKAALVPLAFWLPKSYPQLPPAISALYAAILTKIGLYAFYRTFGMMFVSNGTFPHQEVLFWLAILTMVAGVLGAVAQNDMRRILSFHIISQVGYMALALALFTPLAMAAGIFYLVHHIVVKGNLFIVTGLVEQHAGTSDLAKVSGVVKSSPLVAALFAVPALSLAGLPPLSGFFAKFGLLKASLDLSDWIAAAAVALVGLLTIFSMLKIWVAVFWGSPESNPNPPPPTLNLATSAALALVTIALGLACGPFFDIAQSAANNLINPAAYLEAVLGTPTTPAP